MLGLKPLIGRLIGPTDGQTGSSPVAVVSWLYWKERFNLDPVIVGKQIDVGNVPATVIGVAPREFSGLRAWLRTQMWLSGAAGGALVGRLRDGVTVDQAAAQVGVLYRQAQELEGDAVAGRVKLELEPARTGIALPVLRDRFANPLLALMAIVGMLLLLACVNVAGMLLARGASREREMALRVSLGAGRWRLMRQVLTETMLLSALGALAGVLLAWYGAGVLVRVIASGRRIPGLPASLNISTQPDMNVSLFTTCIAVTAGLLFGLAPALRAITTAPAGSLSAPGRSGESKRGRRFGASLVVGQVAISVLLLSAASQFIERLSQLRHNVGFDRDRVLLLTLDPTGRGLNREQLTGIYRELLERLEAIPGVRSATLCGPTPISGAGASRFVRVKGHPEKPEDRRYVSLAWVAPKYFQTFGTPLLAGRDFSFQDEGRPRVAIVNKTMARYYFGEGNPIGKRLEIDRDFRTGGWYGDDQPYEIVGVAADAKYYEPGEGPIRTVYFNAFQEARIQSNFALRADVSPSSIIPAVRQVVSELRGRIPLERVTTMADQVDASLVPERLAVLLSGAFGALGGLLAAIGLFGLLAHTVARRTNEIGIRVALGATPAAVSHMVLGAALKMAVAGLAAGLPIAIWGQKAASHWMKDLPAGNPLPIALGSAAIIVVALTAAYVPARQAARVDAMEALRHD